VLKTTLPLPSGWSQGAGSAPARRSAPSKRGRPALGSKTLAECKQLRVELATARTSEQALKLRLKINQLCVATTSHKRRTKHPANAKGKHHASAHKNTVIRDLTVWTGGFSITPFTAGELASFGSLSTSADEPPAFLIPIYKAAGRRYHVPWEILAAINAVETDYGRNLNISSAGAIGWMQFMPGTWAEYGVSADGQGSPNPYDPRDAIFSAARLLAANGARTDLRGAIFAYNHAEWYVESVMWWAELIGARAHGRAARESGYALPLDLRYMGQLGRTDDGVDLEGAPDGAPVYSITPGVVTAVAADPGGFGPNYPVVLVTAGPLAGRYIYYGHVAASLVRVGQEVIAGQPIAVIGHTGDAAGLGHGHIEIGFSDSSGDPVNHHGATAETAAGAAMRQVLTDLYLDFLRKRESTPGHATRTRHVAGTRHATRTRHTQRTRRSARSRHTAAHRHIVVHWHLAAHRGRHETR
jgi:murein DD-endopeptidase MepM/ murein hydrolase activator NlpD